MTSTIRISRKCIYCNIEYIAKTIHTKYCSHTCNRRDYKQHKRIEKIEKAKKPINPTIPTNPTNLLTMIARMMDSANPERKQVLDLMIVGKESFL
jgi:hypothetical protein